eukprot:TRINITY_DN296_c1_g1_i1.p3 TRINITY_DN296_c1_g1~~TRINITY_DN296_c1_g1_i1.p3  ORF type:complete len:125 (-),score=16.99 TRINITY_DN296_c1_g1_i1:139-513(-)
MLRSRIIDRNNWLTRYSTNRGCWGRGRRNTPCLLLKGMFNPDEETQQDWDLEIKEDVGEECSKNGDVIHIFVDKYSKGFVYVKMEAVESAQRAMKALHGRWFAGRQIVAEFQFEKVYNKHFGLI